MTSPVKSKPFVSIVIPVRNEEENILSTLEGIIRQDYGIENIEIIVVDGESTDNTFNIVKSYSERIIVLSNPGKYMSMGFNLGLSKSMGELIIMLGGHCKIDYNFISLSVLTIEAGDYDCVGGIINNQKLNNKEKAISVALSSNFGVGGVDFRKKTNKDKFVDTVAFGTYKRIVFYKIGGLDEELIKNQDDEFNFRLTKSGGKIWLNPQIKSTYRSSKSISKLFKQYFMYGYYKVRVIQKSRGIPSWRHLVPGVFVFAILISILTIPISHLPFYLIFGSYLIANLITTLIKSVNSFNPSDRKLITSLTFLPIIFLTLHFSYGFGFLFGIIKFWNQWNDSGVKDFHFDRKQFVKNTKGLSDNEDYN